MPLPRFPDATGSRRIAWSGLPAEVAAGIEARLGCVVVRAVSQPGGFSEGLAARVELADGRRAFVKAADSTRSRSVGEFHRREIGISAALPPRTPAPRLLDSLDDGVWVALMFEDVDGTPPAQPWRSDHLGRVLAAVTDLAECLTPAPPIDVALARPRLGGWSAFGDDRTATGGLAAIAPWAFARLDALRALESRFDEVTSGTTLVHGDPYAFNLLLTAERVVFVDWPHAWIGPAHADLVMLLASLPLSGIDPEPIAARHPLLAQVGRGELDALVALNAGFLLHGACSSGPTADPNLVRMMTALGLSSLRWLSARLR
ncbi:MAG TPA: phosphotransferase [Actinomycetes bacterium]|nr:phosphotransferase [Actinomycetes bacterium]